MLQKCVYGPESMPLGSMHFTFKPMFGHDVALEIIGIFQHMPPKNLCCNIVMRIIMILKTILKNL